MSRTPCERCINYTKYSKDEAHIGCDGHVCYVAQGRCKATGYEVAEPDYGECEDFKEETAND